MPVGRQLFRTVLLDGVLQGCPEAVWAPRLPVHAFLQIAAIRRSLLLQCPGEVLDSSSNTSSEVADQRFVFVDVPTMPGE